MVIAINILTLLILNVDEDDVSNASEDNSGKNLEFTFYKRGFYTFNWNINCTDWKIRFRIFNWK
jgi:hypothetical protein